MALTGSAHGRAAEPGAEEAKKERESGRDAPELALGPDGQVLEDEPDADGALVVLEPVRVDRQAANQIAVVGRVRYRGHIDDIVRRTGRHGRDYGRCRRAVCYPRRRRRVQVLVRMRLGMRMRSVRMHLRMGVRMCLGMGVKMSLEMGVGRGVRMRVRMHLWRGVESGVGMVGRVGHDGGLRRIGSEALMGDHGVGDGDGDGHGVHGVDGGGGRSLVRLAGHDGVVAVAVDEVDLAHEEGDVDVVGGDARAVPVEDAQRHERQRSDGSPVLVVPSVSARPASPCGTLGSPTFSPSPHMRARCGCWATSSRYQRSAWRSAVGDGASVAAPCGGFCCILVRRGRQKAGNERRRTRRDNQSESWSDRDRPTDRRAAWPDARRRAEAEAERPSWRLGTRDLPPPPSGYTAPLPPQPKWNSVCFFALPLRFRVSTASAGVADSLHSSALPCLPEPACHGLAGLAPAPALALGRACRTGGGPR